MSRTFMTGIVCAAALLVACGEKPQTGHAHKSNLQQAWSGAPGDPFVASGWKPGDQDSWERQMRTRSQGQNEYVRGANMQ